MLYIVPGVSNRCCILPLELGVGDVYVSGARYWCCMLSQELGVVAVYCLRS